MTNEMREAHPRQTAGYEAEIEWTDAALRLLEVCAAVVGHKDTSIEDALEILGGNHPAVIAFHDDENRIRLKYAACMGTT
jgi:hypothetical protein